MAPKVDISYEQLIQAIKQLPDSKLLQLKTELTNDGFGSKHIQNVNEFQKLLLAGPVMGDKQHECYKTLRSRFNQSSKK